MSEDEKKQTKKRDRKIVGINISFFVPGDQTKEQQIKMSSSLLNVPNAGNGPEEFNLNDI